MRHESKSSGRRLQALERTDVALQLRREGYSYAEIARRIGVSKQAVHQLVQRAFVKLNSKVSETVQDVRLLESQRLDEMFSRWYAKALDQNKEATEICLKIMQRRARLLGLDVQKDMPAFSILNQQQNVAIKFSSDELQQTKQILSSIGVIDEPKNGNGADLEQVHSDQTDTDTAGAASD